MKALVIFLSILAALSLGCSVTFDLKPDGNTITPSDVVITEERQVSGFDAIDFRSFGEVKLSQGDEESLTVTGSDNVVAVMKTTVVDGTLVIESEKNLNFNSLKGIKLTYDIVVKDLGKLTVSGLGSIEMDALTTDKLDVVMSGAGSLTLDELSADSLDVNVSGLGSATIGGKVSEQSVEISGAGSVQNGNLECETAEVDVPGLGSATLWVTENLTGNISGSGSVSYYGDPQTETTVSGLGSFKSMGDK